MLQIPKLGTTRLRYEELFGHVKKVVNCGRATLSQEMDKPILDALEVALNNFDEVLEQSRKNSFTQRQLDADKEFDSTYVHAHAYARVMPFFPVKAAAEAGVKILDVFDKYGNITELGYVEEYAKAHNLIQDLEALGTEMLTAANFTPWMDALSLAQAQFTVLRESKQAEDTATITGAAKDARVAVEAAYDVFVKKINAMCLVMGDEHYATFINHVTTFVEEMQAIIKARATRNANAKAKEDAEKPETEVGEGDVVE